MNNAAIIWPEGYLPGHVDNYVSNEVVRTGLEAAAAWKVLTDTSGWPSFYANVSEIRFHDGKGPVLAEGSRFRFTTFSFPVEAEVTEFVPPQAGQAGRIAWHGWVEGGPEERLDVIHAWILEDLPGGRLRILTQESQNGKPARDMAAARPNPMLNAHQDWIEGLAAATARLGAG